MQLKQLDPQDMDLDAVTTLTAYITGAMMETINGDDEHEAIPWNHAVFAVALAIKAVSGLAMHREGISEAQVKEAVTTAIFSGLLTDVHTQRVSSKAEFEEVKAAMQQSAQQSRH